MEKSEFLARIESLSLKLMADGKMTKEDLPRLRNVARDIIYRRLGQEARRNAPLTAKPFASLLK